MRQGRGKKHQLMGFFKKVKHIPRKKLTQEEVAAEVIALQDMGHKRLAIESTVSPADTFAVLKSLGSVLGSYMADGRTVKLDGVGTFYYTAVASGNGVDSPDKVTAKQITGVRVRFIPETSRSSNNQVTTRSLVDSNIFWEEWGGKSTTPSEGGGGGEGGGEAPDPAA